MWNLLRSFQRGFGFYLRYCRSRYVSLLGGIIRTERKRSRNTLSEGKVVCCDERRVELGGHCELHISKVLNVGMGDQTYMGECRNEEQGETVATQEFQLLLLHLCTQTLQVRTELALIVCQLPRIWSQPHFHLYPIMQSSVLLSAGGVG